MSPTQPYAANIIWSIFSLSTLVVLAGTGIAAGGDPLPFNHKVEVYRNEKQGVTVFALRLEQPFLAEEFEASNDLRLEPTDDKAYLIYSKEGRFRQKHAEFYGRLRGEGRTKLRLSYETVREKLDGSRQVDVNHGEIEIAIPTEDTGPADLYAAWAKGQNEYFFDLLTYYPDESFFQYCLLESHDRYGVQPPDFMRLRPPSENLETDLYQVFSGSLAIQESLQQQSLRGSAENGELNIHVSQLSPPRLESPNYASLLEEKARQGVEPKPQAIARLVPEDHYFLHFRSLAAAGELADLTADWGDNLLRLFTVHARDNHLQQKLEDQLCLLREPLTKLFSDEVIGEFAIAGSDPFAMEGSDVTLIFQLARPEAFRQAAAEWLADVRRRYPEMTEREFNYRGHKIAVRYTDDRRVSSFAVEHGDYTVYSNSHRAVRLVIDAAEGKTPNLFEALDYRYLTTLLPPSDEPNCGYLFASEAFIKRNIGPELKISEKRRLQCFNNLVMLNHASMFYRLENSRSPASLSDLVEGRFVDLSKVACPHGGAYAFDAEHDTCTCSLHNRLKYLTPNTELSVQQVSAAEKKEYERYKERYRAFWQRLFDPLAMRITVGRQVKLELCALPLANSSLYTDLKGHLDERPKKIDTSRVAPTAILTSTGVFGRKQIGEMLKQLPGITEALEADPTLTDMSWLGDRAGFHLCDADTVIEVDPTRLRPLLGVGTFEQTLAAAAVWSVEMPTYMSIDVEDTDKARRLLEQLATRIFLRNGSLFGVPTSLDAYRLPDYRDHAVYVVSYQVHLLKVRLHLALVGDQLIAATTPETLHQVIDAAAEPADRPSVEAHLLVRLDRRAINRLTDDLELYWEEKSRLACHRNSISIYNLVKLYGVDADDTDKLSDAKYGVTWFCPDGGEYRFDRERDQVLCSVHGNRQHARQQVDLAWRSSFRRFFESIDAITASLRSLDDGLIATVEIDRAEE
ncbi:MAG: hypothetical protein B7Z73_09130 [Planctomycetia bacterium 21-64-5]|nr:MAG: hypothetical protein B7Z73_09130 [Planctomycetia bacterium 21-64-5]